MASLRPSSSCCQRLCKASSYHVPSDRNVLSAEGDSHCGAVYEEALQSLTDPLTELELGLELELELGLEPEPGLELEGFPL